MTSDSTSDSYDFAEKFDEIECHIRQAQKAFEHADRLMDYYRAQVFDASEGDPLLNVAHFCQQIGIQHLVDGLKIIRPVQDDLIPF